MALALGLFLFPGCNDSYSIYDEGIAVYGAERVEHGQVPYRDFWTMYAPGQYYLLALLFKIFGTKLIVERVLATSIATILCFLICATMTKSASRSEALLCTALTAFWLGGLKFFGSPMPTALAFAMASALFFTQYLGGAGRRHLLATGLFAGVATLFRHDIGGYVIVSESIMLMVTAAARRVKPQALDYLWHPKWWRPLATLLGGYALVLIPVAGYFLVRVPAADLVSDLITFPSEIYPRMRSLPFPALWSAAAGNHSWLGVVRAIFSPSNPSLAYYLPPAVYAVAAAVLLYHLRLRRLSALTAPLMIRLFFLVLGVLFFIQASVRSDIHHFLPTFLPAIILSGLLLVDLEARLRLRRGAASYAIAIAITIVSALSVQRSSLLYRLNLIAETVIGAQHCHLPGSRASEIRIDGDCSDYRALIRFIQESVPPGEKIFVGNTRHDRIVKNDILLYFLTDRECAVRYHELHPGLATTAVVQQEIVDDIRESGVRFIILCDIKGNEPNESSVSSDVFLLDDYLGREFPIVCQFGRYSIGRRDVDANHELVTPPKSNTPQNGFGCRPSYQPY